MMKSFEQFDNFVQLSKTRRFAQAYSLAESYKLFRQSVYFKAMEEEWEKSLKGARELLNLNKEQFLIPD